jgi:hypothetical protein
VYSTYGGYYPCFDPDGKACPDLKGINIKTCRSSSTPKTKPPVCSNRTEGTWRYFSFGNKVLDAQADGAGDVIGQPYKVGTDTLTTLIYSKLSCNKPRTTDVVLRASCRGGENYVLN